MVVVAGPNRFVHHVDVFEVRELGGNSIEPLGDILLGLFDGNARVLGRAEEVGLLGAPDEGVEFEVSFTRFFLGPLVAVFAAVETVEVEFALSAVVNGMDGAPLAAVFVGKLVPVGAHIRADRATRSDVAKKLCSTIGKGCVRNGGKAHDREEGKRERKVFHTPHPFLFYIQKLF